MAPILIATIAIVGIATLCLLRGIEIFRKFLAGAFFVSAGLQFYSLFLTDALTFDTLKSTGAYVTSRGDRRF